MDEADDGFVAVGLGWGDAWAADGDCGEACRKPAQKSTRRETRTSLWVNFVTASPDQNAKVFVNRSIAESGEAADADRKQPRLDRGAWGSTSFTMLDRAVAPREARAGGVTRIPRRPTTWCAVLQRGG